MFPNHSWPSELSLSAKSSRSLWQFHEQLVNVELFENTYQQGIKKVNVALQQLHEVKELRISPETPAARENVSLPLFNMRSIETLHVDMRHMSPPTRNGEVNTTGVVIDGVSENLFKDNVPRCSRPLQLVTLMLWNVNLSHSYMTWTRVIESALLKSVELVNCPSTSTFLREVCSNAQLEKLAILYNEESAGSEDHDIPNTLLLTLKHQSRALWLDCKDEQAHLDRDSLADICGGLERLYLRMGSSVQRVSYAPWHSKLLPNQAKPVNVESSTTFFPQSVLLRELTIAFPVVLDADCNGPGGFLSIVSTAYVRKTPTMLTSPSSLDRLR